LFGEHQLIVNTRRGRKSEYGKVNTRPGFRNLFHDFHLGIVIRREQGFDPYIGYQNLWWCGVVTFVEFTEMTLLDLIEFPLYTRAMIPSWMTTI